MKPVHNTKPKEASDFPCGSLQGGVEHFAITADGHFFLPVFCGGAFAAGSTHKPAKVASLKFPGRAFFFTGAFFQHPAILPFAACCFSLIHRKKTKLPLYMNGNGAPPLLITLHRLEGNPQELGQCFLGFPQFGSQIGKCGMIHSMHLNLITMLF